MTGVRIQRRQMRPLAGQHYRVVTEMRSTRDELQQLQTVLPPKPGVADREQTKFHGFIHLPIVTTRLKRHVGEVVCRYDDVE